MVALLREPLAVSLLITDDDEACLSRFGDTFASGGYDTYLAACGKEAIRIARTQSVHVAILDMHMPDMSGLDTFVEIRKETGHNVPAILVSHDSSKELQLKALAARFAAFMSKPVHLSVLRRVVGELALRNYPGGRWLPLGDDEQRQPKIIVDP